MPDLNFRVEGAEALEFAAVPTLIFKLGIENAAGEPVRSVSLTTQIRIAAARRPYTAAERERLRELFGDASRWGETLKSLLWTHATAVVPPFTGSTTIDLPVACTYDFEVANAKYLHALQGGEVPLEFLFSGTIFFAGATGLQVAQISWEKEAQFRLPVEVWQRMMQHYFPNQAWLRLERSAFDRLYDFRTRQGLPTWEAALDRLLQASEEEVPR